MASSHLMSQQITQESRRLHDDVGMAESRSYVQPDLIACSISDRLERFEQSLECRLVGPDEQGCLRRQQ
jgi:hypothetical protein